MDKDMRRLITLGSLIDEGMTMIRKTLKQSYDKTANNDPAYAGMQVLQPKAIDSYYTFCNKIDQYNMCRQ